MKGIIWIASYPKSGNTWFRIFLTNLLRDKDEPEDINDLEQTPIASDRAIFDDETGIEASDLTADEIDKLRPLVYEQFAEQAEEPLFMKVHDAWTLLPDGTPLLSTGATKGAVYIIRNPLDVVISYAHHSGTDIDQAIISMGDGNAAFCSKTHRLHSQLRQRLLSWSGHVRSWVDNPGLTIHVMKYEDMLARPVDTFTKAVQYAGLPTDREKIEKALAFSSFDVLRSQEQEKGFRERSTHNQNFFRKGIAGDWRNTLRADQIERIIADHGEVMKRFGYL